METKEENETNWFLNSSIHGFADLYRSKTLLGKIHWSVVIAVCSCFLLRSGYDIVSDIISRDPHVLWTVHVQSKPDHQGLPFPNVTFCSYNRLRESGLQTINFTAELRNYLYYSLESLYNFEGMDWTDENDDALDELLKPYFVNGNEVGPIMIQLMGHTCEMSLVSIVLNKRLYNSPCQYTPDQPFKVIQMRSPEFYLCFTVVFDENYTQKMTGSDHGIEFTLFTNADDYSRQQRNNYWDEGFAMQMIMDRSSPDLGGHWIALPPSFHSLVAMTTTRSVLQRSSVEWVQPPCMLDVCSFQSFDMPYNCLGIVNVEGKLRVLPDDFYTVDSCKCISLLPYAKYPPCKSLTGYNRCKRALTKKPIPDEWQLRLHECKSKCLPRCNSRDVHHQISVTGYPAKVQLSSIRKLLIQDNNMNLSENEIADQLIGVSLYYADLTVDSNIMSQKYGITEICSQIGGLAGLCLGASLISIVQGIVYFCHFVCRSIHSRWCLK